MFKFLKAAKFTILAILVVIVIYVFTNRSMLSLRIFALTFGEVELGEMVEEKEGVKWYDDYFTVEYIDAETIAIGEPRYWQANYNYLILGDTRAILFGSGPGVRDIAPLVHSLTSLPVTVVLSHLHFDHVGNHGKFTNVALIDLPHLRAIEENGNVQLEDGQHLGFLEGTSSPALRVSEWWNVDEVQDLGGRKLKVIYAPGHIVDSIVLYDAERRQLFAGDFIYPGPLFAYLPDSSLDDYLNTAKNLLSQIDGNSVLLTAHRMEPPGAPILNYSDLQELQATLQGIKDGSMSGEGIFPVTYHVNDHIQLLTDISW